MGRANQHWHGRDQRVVEVMGCVGRVVFSFEMCGSYGRGGLCGGGVVAVYGFG